MITIPLIRRDLTSDLVGRHIYLFGADSAPTEILQRLAETGERQGTVVLAAAEGTKLSIAVLFRPGLTHSAIPLFSVISTLALVEAIAGLDLDTSPVWPDQVAIGDEAVGRGLVVTAPAFDRTSYVILGAELDVQALEARLARPVDWNVVVAAFLNALDTWATAYAEHGPAAVRAAVQFLPRGSRPASRDRESVLPQT